MKTYQVTSPVTLSGGKVKLTKKQADVREHALRKLKAKDTYDVIAPTSFKVGELITLDEDLPRAVALCLEEPSEAPAAEGNMPGADDRHDEDEGAGQ